MVNLIIVHKNLETDQLFLDSLVKEGNYLVTQTQINDDTKQLTDLLELEGVTEVKQLAVAYHYPGYSSIPFFRDIPTHEVDEDGNPFPREKPEYHSFSTSFVELLGNLKTKGLETFDILTCSLNDSHFKEEAKKLEETLEINVRYSFNDTGNAVDWILESDDVNIRDVYFNEQISVWNKLLTSAVTLVEVSGVLSISDNSSGGKTYTLQNNIFINELNYNNGTSNILLNHPTNYIQLDANDVFDGNGYEINLSGVTTGGLFSCNGTSLENAPEVKNLGVTNGRVSDDGGFIIRQSQSYFKVTNCYNTGFISGNSAGGIAGASAGYQGECTITNCYNTGGISGNYAGGIAGYGAGYNGSCTITNCYNTGDISDTDAGEGAGGIAGYNSGYYGECTITNCYNTGEISSTNAGGIAGATAGNGGECIITNCYNTGDISGNSAGGIAGYDAGSYGSCTITNCYNTGDISSTNAGGIAGYEAGSYGSCTIQNSFSQQGNITGSSENVTQRNTYGPNVEPESTTAKRALYSIEDLKTATWDSYLNVVEDLNFSNVSEAYVGRTNASGVIPLLNLETDGKYYYIKNGRSRTIEIGLKETTQEFRDEWYRTQLNDGESLENPTTGDDSTGDDSTAPVITITGENPVIIEKGNIYEDAGATSGNDIITGTGTVDANVVGEYTITYTVQYSGGVITETRTVNVIETTIDNFTKKVTIIAPSAMQGTFSIEGTTYSPNTITENSIYKHEYYLDDAQYNEPLQIYLGPEIIKNFTLLDIYPTYSKRDNKIKLFLENINNTVILQSGTFSINNETGPIYTINVNINKNNDDTFTITDENGETLYESVEDLNRLCYFTLPYDELPQNYTLNLLLNYKINTDQKVYEPYRYKFIPNHDNLTLTQFQATNKVTVKVGDNINVEAIEFDNDTLNKIPVQNNERININNKLYRNTGLNFIKNIIIMSKPIHIMKNYNADGVWDDLIDLFKILICNKYIKGLSEKNITNDNIGNPFDVTKLDASNETIYIEIYNKICDFINNFNDKNEEYIITYYKEHILTYFTDLQSQQNPNIPYDVLDSIHLAMEILYNNISFLCYNRSYINNQLANAPQRLRNYINLISLYIDSQQDPIKSYTEYISTNSTTLYATYAF
jgi:hypothetical protein